MPLSLRAGPHARVNPPCAGGDLRPRPLVPVASLVGGPVRGLALALARELALALARELASAGLGGPREPGAPLQMAAAPARLAPVPAILPSESV